MLSIKEKVELRNTLHVVILSTFTVFVSLASSKNNVLVGIVTSHTFKNWFESHAWRAGRAPEINNDSRGILDDFLDDC